VALVQLVTLIWLLATLALASLLTLVCLVQGFVGRTAGRAPGGAERRARHLATRPSARRVEPALTAR
jgi:hypothetical protein